MLGEGPQDWLDAVVGQSGMSLSLVLASGFDLAEALSVIAQDGFEQAAYPRKVFLPFTAFAVQSLGTDCFGKWCLNSGRF
jgi:hypothetical protein